MKISVLGVGNRGSGYIYWIKRYFKNAVFDMLCDKNVERTDYIYDKYHFQNKFYNTSDFFKVSGSGSALIIATQDKDHVKHAVMAIDAGYKEILLEKPVSPVYKDIEDLLVYANSKGVNITICHVLRYSKYYRMIKEIIDSGEIGEVVDIDHRENVGYFHFAHSYVRGNWRSSEETSPFIMAKCSHDFDLFHYFLGTKCISLSSFGELKYFKKENIPKDAGERCIECRADCPYNALKLYIKDPFYKATFVKYNGPTITGKPKPSKEDKMDAIRNGAYGRCVFRCDNNVCDHQTVIMKFENGVSVSHTVSAFTKDFSRETHINGTLGEIIANDKTTEIKVNIFHKKSYKKHGKPLLLRPLGHIDGDINLIKNWYSKINKLPYDASLVTSLKDTLASQKMAIGAEYSRMNNGEVVEINL